MKSKETGFKTVNGVLPFKVWHDIGHGFSIMPLKTTFHVKHNESGRIVRPKGQAGQDSLGMALYDGTFPNYIFYAFSKDETQQVRRLKSQAPKDTFIGR